MNCEKCPHRELIEKARSCCLACNPDAESHHGSSHVQATDYTLAKRIDNEYAFTETVDPALAMEIQDHNSASGVTKLRYCDENRLRVSMATLFGLDPVELLLVQHLFLGGDLASFDESERAVATRILRYRGEPRGRAFQLKEAIIRKWPKIEPVFKRLIRPSSKKGNRTNRDSIEDQLNAERVTPDLFEFSS